MVNSQNKSYKTEMHSIKSSQVSFVTVPSINALTGQLNYCIQEEFTGQLDLQFENSQQWTLHFNLGRLIWGAGGLHPIRRWRRQLYQYCPTLTVGAHKQPEDWPLHLDYGSLTALLKEGKVQSKEVQAVVNGLIVEILFDIFQQWEQGNYTSELKLIFKYTQPNFADSIRVTVPVYFALSEAIPCWQAWQKCGLKRYSQNQAPKICDSERLQKRLLPSTYQNLATLMTGDQTLRDIAIQCGKDPLTITKSLIPHLNLGLIKLVEVDDLKTFVKPFVKDLPQLQSISQSNSYGCSQPSPPLIAHIDDSKIEGQIMGRILTSMGYRFLHIEEPLQSLPLLLKHEPSLIFLDLVMPIINGYEACAQIHRISKFKDTPVIILTGKDGVMDRIRAKLSGSTDFLTKPITVKKVEAILQKYLTQFFSVKS